MPVAATRSASSRSTPRQSVAGRSEKMSSGRARDPATGTRSGLGGDQPVVLVAALEQHVEAVALRVAEHHEAVLGGLELDRRLLDGHRLDLHVRGLDDARRRAAADRGALEHLHRPAMAVGAIGAPALVDQFLARAPDLLLGLVHRQVDGVEQAGVVLLGGLGHAQPVGDVDLGDVAVFLDVEDHLDLDRLLDEFHHLPQLRLDEAAQPVVEVHVAAGVVDLHGGSSLPAQKICLRSVDEGMLSSSRYLATVRRAIWIPSRFWMRISSLSESGRFGSSAWIICSILRFTVSDEMFSPYSRSMPLWKKNFIGKRPRWVWMYLLETTRLTVDSCMPMSSATSRSTIGRR